MWTTRVPASSIRRSAPCSGRAACRRPAAARTPARHGPPAGGWRYLPASRRDRSRSSFRSDSSASTLVRMRSTRACVSGSVVTSRSEALNSPSAWSELPQIVAGRREETRLRQARLLGPLALGLRLLLLHLEGLDQGEVLQAEPDAAADRPALQTGEGNQEGEVETERGREGQVLTSTEEGQAENRGHQRRGEDGVDRRQVIRLGGDVGGRNECGDHQERGDAERARRVQEEDRRQAPAGPVRQDHPGVAAGPHLARRSRPGSLAWARSSGTRIATTASVSESQARMSPEATKPPHDGNQAEGATTEAHPARPLAGRAPGCAPRTRLGPPRPRVPDACS